MRLARREKQVEHGKLERKVMDLMLAAVPGVGVILFAGGVVTGLLFGMFVLPGGREAKRLAQELEALKTEHEQYKGEVTGHFQKSAELFAGMTQSYKAVYDHLAGGARTLCETPSTDNAIAFRGTRLIEIDEGGEPIREPAAAAAAPATDQPAADDATEEKSPPAADRES
ncbi:MAG: uncharacterized membrane-anchored protein YhcB (DUF1043 family) [Hyphomicrobiaceae bacterium]